MTNTYEQNKTKSINFMCSPCVTLKYFKLNLVEKSFKLV